MTIKPKISLTRGAEVYKEMVECRRLMFGDTDFFKMSDVIENLCKGEFDEDGVRWRLKTYKSDPEKDFKRRLGVIELDGKISISMDERFWNAAQSGCKFANFSLAHELGHVGLGHHEINAVVKNYQPYQDSGINMNIPPTNEELETNYAAVFFQCGVALEDSSWSAVRLARVSYSDQLMIEKAMGIVRMEEFQRTLSYLKRRNERVVF